MKLYFVSAFGDISIEHDEKNKNDVIIKTNDLTSKEEKLVEEIVNEFEFKKIENNKHVGGKETVENISIVLKNVRIEDVHNFMKKKLKGNKPTLTVIKMKDGKIELCEELKGDIDKAATVDKPEKGCPMPIMIRSEVRASAVLKEFLTDSQIKDFESNTQIICKGNWTGNTYLITGRWNPEVNKYGQLYDIVNRHVVCASCKDIPPSEEILSLKLMIEHKEREFLGM